MNSLHSFCIISWHYIVPVDLLYLPETQAFPAIFEFLKEEASVAGMKSFGCVEL